MERILNLADHDDLHEIYNHNPYLFRDGEDLPSSDPGTTTTTSGTLLPKATTPSPSPMIMKMMTILPSTNALQHARSSLPSTLNPSGHGTLATTNHILRDVVPGLSGASLSPRFYGFVTGGVTPAAYLADGVVSAYDQNVQVHLDRDTVATDIEMRALEWIREMLDLRFGGGGGGGGGKKNGEEGFEHVTFTTGATASNVLGLAVGREWVVMKAAERNGVVDAGVVVSVGREGLLKACRKAGVDEVQVLTDLPHSSVAKAAAIVGIGSDSVRSVRREEGDTSGGGGGSDDPVRLDLEKLRKEANRERTVSILSVSCGEVNTGFFGTSGLEEMREVRRICDELGVWLHVDGAFGIFGRILKKKNHQDHTRLYSDSDSVEEEDYEVIRKGCEGVELADSITGDCHKFLNVPYDCGFFLSRSVDLAQRVLQNPNAACLPTTKDGDGGSRNVPNPLNIGIENSRRFRALPVYATLHAYGVEEYRKVLREQIKLAREVVGWLWDTQAYKVLPKATSKEEAVRRTFTIVLFCAEDDELNERLVEKINYGEEGRGEIYVSGTTWDGRKAVRIAVSNWQVDWKRDFDVVKRVLERVVVSKC